MRGPLAARPEVLAALLPLVDATVQSALPGITQFEAFPAADSALLNDWYAAAGYAPLQVHAALRAEASGWPERPVAAARALAADLPAVIRLHDELFPSTYLGEPAFRRALDASDCALFVARDADGPAVGYLYVEAHPADQEAYVHFLGVATSRRGSGLGRALLAAAARWGVERGFPHVALTVREDRPGARGLYDSAGFIEVSTGRHWRKKLGDPAQPTKA
jgi:ribosomal protein S18 acetylase RimI-like enzyme